MANKIVNKGDAQFAFLVPVTASTPAKTFVQVGKVRGLTRDNSRVGKDGLSYAVVGTNDLIAQTANSSTWAAGDPVYVTAGGVLTQTLTSNTLVGIATRAATGTSATVFVQLIPSAV
jgi:predicted RecA/RadA family phage recombinase